MRLPGDARRVTFRDDYKEKWDMMTKQMKKRELDKFFFSKVECTGIPQYGYASIGIQPPPHKIEGLKICRSFM